MPIEKRPYMAADIFVEYYVISVNGKPPENYIAQRWFKNIINPIMRWYKNKYGNIVFKKIDKVALGMVIFSGVFFELSIPLSVTIPKGDLRDYIIPKEILSIEKEVDFIKHPPILSEENSEMKKLEENIREVVGKTRSINKNIIFSDVVKQEHLGLVRGTQANLDKAILDILSGEPIRCLNAFWEFHIAIEKSIKILILQNKGTFRKIHDLTELSEELADIYPDLTIKQRITKLPKDRDAIKYRYGAGPVFSNAKIFKTYINTLSIIDDCTNFLKRKVVFDNVVFTLGKLPWQG